MKLTPPTKILYWIATVLGALGILGKFIASLPIIPPYSCWLLLIAFVLFWIGNTFKGL